MKDKYHGYELHNRNYPDSLIESTEDVSPESKAFILAERDENRQRYQRELTYGPELVQRIIDRIVVVEVIRYVEVSENGREWSVERIADVED